MTRVVYIIGALLVLAGATFIALGVPVVRLEIGWSEIIGGAVGGAGGFVVLALGTVLARLEAIHHTLLDQSAIPALRGSLEDRPVTPDREEMFVSAPPPSQPHPLAPTPERRALFDLPAPVRPEPALADAPLHEAAEESPFEKMPDLIDSPELDEGAPALAGDDILSPPVSSVEPVEPEVAAEPARNRPNFLAAFLARRAAAPVAHRASERGDPLVEPLPSPGPTSGSSRSDLSSGWDDEDLGPPSLYARDRDGDRSRITPAVVRDFDEEPAAPSFTSRRDADGPSRDEEGVQVETAALADEDRGTSDEVPAPLSPAVVGRYNAGSASYVMYSNGMIEVETENGTHQFGSMQELKAFIEKRDAAKV